MKKKVTLFFAVMLVLSVSLPAQEKLAGGFLYGDNWFCKVEAPEGWGMDQKSFASHGIYGLFYENDKKLGGSTPIIYINTQKLNGASDKDLKNYIAADTNSYKQNGYKVKKCKLKNIKEKTVFAYELNMENNYEICVYTRYNDCCFLVILAAHDKNSIAENIPNLEFIVNRMKFLDVFTFSSGACKNRSTGSKTS